MFGATSLLDELLLQAVKALTYYAALVVIMRLAGKRLAGQTTTFDRPDHAWRRDPGHGAALRKLGYDSPDPIKLAVLEETGHISAVGADDASPAVTSERRNP